MAGQRRKAPVPRNERIYATYREINKLYGLNLRRASKKTILTQIAEAKIENIYGYESGRRLFYRLNAEGWILNFDGSPDNPGETSNPPI